jgi:hypothetical protein
MCNSADNTLELPCMVDRTIGIPTLGTIFDVVIIIIIIIIILKSTLEFGES